MANQVHGPEGMIFANKYRIVKLIGSGGMANVYLGIDMNTGANVAIKILKPEFSSDDEFIRRFDAEAKSVASLNHANIVKVYGVGHEGNFRYIVQEYIEGITVKDLINQNGHLKVEGQKSTFYRGISPAMAGLPSTNGRQNRLITPNVQSFEMTLTYG